MARPVKVGLDYFPVDIDIFNDEKIEFVTALYGLVGEAITMRLLTKIYRNGYYIKWDEDVAILFSSKIKIEDAKQIVDGVVMELLKRDFLNQEIFTSHGVLTSRGIQRRYIKACLDSKRKVVEILKDYDLTGFNSELTRLTPKETKLTPSESTQSKVKESKPKESKEKEPELIYSPLNFEKIKNMYAENTKIQDPNEITHIKPILNFYKHIPEHLTDDDINDCITNVFKSVDKSKGVRVDFLCSNIQAKITAKHEGILNELKQPLLDQADRDRKKEKASEKAEKLEYSVKKAREYKEFFEENSDLFTVKEKTELVELLQQKKLIQAGAIIEPKMQVAPLV